MSTLTVSPTQYALTVTENGLGIVSVGTQGPAGATGATGSQGPAGSDGVGVPAGGAADTLLVKLSSTDFDTGWLDLFGSANVWSAAQTFSAPVAVNDTLTAANLVGDGSGLTALAPANVAAGVFVASQVFTAPLIVRQSGGVAGTDQIEVSHTGSAAKLRNRDTGGITVYSSADALLLTFADDGTVRGNGNLVLEQTGDTFGTTRLKIQNRTGVNGALFEQAGSVDLIDFIFKTLSHQRTIRVESRGGSVLGGTAPEFQIGDVSNPSLVVNDDTLFVRRRLKSTKNAPATLSANTNNYAPGTYFLQRWTASTPVNVTGMVAGYDGEIRLIMNCSASTITLTQNDAASSAGNRWFSYTGAAVALTANRMCLTVYDSTDSLWRVWLLA